MRMMRTIPLSESNKRERQGICKQKHGGVLMDFYYQHAWYIEEYLTDEEIAEQNQHKRILKKVAKRFSVSENTAELILTAHEALQQEQHSVDIADDELPF
jgi:hypothetical protein